MCYPPWRISSQQSAHPKEKKKMKFKIKPEVNEFRYWVHLIIIASVVLGVLQLLKLGNMFTLTNIMISVPIIALGDVIAHTLLQLD